MKKKILKTLLFLILSCVVALSFMACDNQNCKGCKSCNDDGDASKTSILLNTDTIQITIDEVRELTVSHEGVALDPAEVKFASEDTNVALVDDEGFITGYAQGETYVTATYKDATAKCFVQVVTNNQKPKIIFSVTDYEAFNSKGGTVVALNDTLDLTATVSFDNKIFTDAKFEYTLSNNLLGEVRDGIFYASSTLPANASGQIIVNALWRGSVAEEKIIDITLINALTVTINGKPNMTLNYTTMTEVDGPNRLKETTFPFDVVVTDSQSNAPLDVEIDFDAAKYANVVKLNKTTNVFTVIGIGEATVNIVLAENGAFLRSVKIITNPYIYKQEIEGTFLFDATDGCFENGLDDLRKIFGGNTQLFGAEFVDRGLTLVAEDGAIKGVEVKGKNEKGEIIEVKEEKINVYNSKFGYTVTVKVYTKLINDIEDVKWLNCIEGAEYKESLANARRLDGYYLMTKDIDMSGYDYANVPINSYGGWQTDNNSGKVKNLGLVGVFDGNGHIFNNMQGMAGGVFQFINGVVKNVAFKNVQLVKRVASDGNTEITSTVLAGRIFGQAEINNVYISISDVKEGLEKSTRFGGFANVMTQTAKITNVVVVFNADHSEELSKKPYPQISPFIIFVARNSSNGYVKGNEKPFSALKNVLVVSDMSLSTGFSSSTNPYIIEASNVTTDKFITTADGNVYKFADNKDANTTVRRYSTMDLLAQDLLVNGVKDTILEDFEKNENWLITSEGKIYWGNGDSLCINGNEGITEKNLYFDNTLGFDTSAEITFTRQGVDYTSDIEFELSADGIVKVEENVIKPFSQSSRGTVIVTIKLNGEVVTTLTITVKSVYDDAKIIVKADGKEIADETIRLYFNKDGKPLDKGQISSITAVLVIDKKEITTGYTLTVKNGSDDCVTIDGNKVTAKAEGEATVVVTYGDGITEEISIKALRHFSEDDLTSGGDFKPDWIENN